MNMWRLFSKNRPVQEDQQRLFFALEKIVNVALVKTERGDNQSVKEILNNLEQIFRRFWQLKKDDPDKFQSLLWSKDFFEKYVEPLGKQEALVKDDFQEAESVEDLIKQAAFLLSFAPERELKGLTRFLGSFEKIWECALRNGNDEISRYVVYHLNWLLAELTQEPSNSLFVEEFLRLTDSMTSKAIESSKSDRRIDASVYSVAIYWYTDIVFNAIRTKERSFDVSYLNLFDKHFFSKTRYIVSEDQTTIFHSLVSSLESRISLTPNKGAIWNYGHLVLLSDPKAYQELNREHGIEGRIQELASLENNLDTREKLDRWLEKFGELKKILRPNLTKDQKEKASKLEKEIEEGVVSQFKYNNLLEIVFAIGAYCLFKQKPGYIRYIWEYKQPPDSDASWVGPDIVPNALTGMINLYYGKGTFGRKSHLWEGHHGTERYYKQYFLLLVANILQNMAQIGEKSYEQIQNYDLPDLDIYLVSDIEGSVDNLIDMAKGLREHEDLLRALGFDMSNLDELFHKGLIPFLQTLKAKAQERIRNIKVTRRISPTKLTEFKNKVLEAFNKSAILRNILKNCRLYEDKTKETYEGSLRRLGTNSVDHKSAFFEKWHVHYVDWGTNYGKSLAIAEDSYLLNEIAENCAEIDKERFEKTLSSFDDLSKVIILATNVALYRFFERSRNFKPKWHKGSPPLDVEGFEGWYEFKRELIPIFGTYRRGVAKQILILNKSKLGKLIQYSPLNEGEDKKLLEDIFYMRIQVFSEDQELLNKFIEKPPEWLQEIGDKQEQEEYLKERVLIQIFERFAYNVDKEFEGYLLRLED